MAALKSWHASVLGVQAEISKIKNRELFTGKHASSYMAGSKVKQAKWTRHSDYKLCMMKCYRDQRYDALNGGIAWSADATKSTQMGTTFDMCGDKEVDVVIGPGGYQTNRQFYPLKLNSTYDLREYGIAMMEEREGAPLGCNDGVSTANSFQTYTTNPDGTKSIASTDAVFNVGGFYFHSPVVEWQGYCEGYECYRCKEDATRCTGEKGVSQTCHNGVWVRSKGLSDLLSALLNLANNNSQTQKRADKGNDWDHTSSPTWTPSSSDVPPWNQSQYKRCQPAFTSWQEMRRQISDRSVQVKTGGLGALLIPGEYESWVCVYEDACALGGDWYFCYVFQESTQKFVTWDQHFNLNLSQPRKLV